MDIRENTNFLKKNPDTNDILEMNPVYPAGEEALSYAYGH